MLRFQYSGMLTLILCLPLVLTEKLTLWAIAKAWPIPLPVHYNSTLLPTLFSTSCDNGLPCIKPTGEPASLYTASNYSLLGTLCFTVKNSSLPCIWMGNGTLGHWIDPLKDYQASPGILAVALSEISQGAAKGDGGRSSSSNINVTTLLFLHNSLRPGEPGIVYTQQFFPQKNYCLIACLL